MRNIRWAVAGLATVFAVAGCAPTQVQSTYQRDAAMPRPEQVLVYDFAVSPEDVQLDRGLGAEVEQMAKGTPRTEQEIQLGPEGGARPQRRAGRADQRDGPAGPARGGRSQPLGAGGPDRGAVRLHRPGQQHRAHRDRPRAWGTARCRPWSRSTRREARSWCDSRSSPPTPPAASEPGAAETMGVGAAAGTLGVSAAVTAAGTVASEAFGATVEADAQRTAANVADKLQTYFTEQGWIQPQ